LDPKTMTSAPPGKKEDRNLLGDKVSIPTQGLLSEGKKKVRGE